MFFTMKLCTYAQLTFLIELFICIKIDLVLNNRQRLIRHKTKTTNNHLELIFSIEIGPTLFKLKLYLPNLPKK